MAKKRKAKKRSKPAPFRKVPTKRGSNILHFKGHTKEIKKGSNIPAKDLRYLINKNKRNAGKIDKKTGKKILPEPQAVVLIFEVKTTDGEKKTISKVSSPDMVVNESNVRGMIDLTFEDLINTLEELSEQFGYGNLDPQTRVNQYSLKFIY